MLPVRGRLYFTRPDIRETEIKQNCRRSAGTKPRQSAVLFYFSFISPCATGLTHKNTLQRAKINTIQFSFQRI